jgi:VanZ family protein
VMSALSMLLKIAAWMLVAGLVLATVVPASERPVTGVNHNLEHFLAFAFSAAVFALAHPKLKLVPLLAAGTAFTLGLELMQIPLPTRHARLADFLYDTAAVWCAFMAVQPFVEALLRLSRAQAE